MISHCETKMSILTAIDVGILGTIIGIYGSNSFFVCYSCNPIYWIVTIYLMLVCLGCFASLLVSCFAALSKFNQPKKEDKNIFFYKEVSEMSEEEYLNKINDNPLQQLARENIVLSRVALQKYKTFNIAMHIMLSSMTFCITLFIYFVKRTKSSK